MITRVDEARTAALEALRLRRDCGIALDAPLNPIDTADRIGVEVWYVDVPSLEGLFIRSSTPRILLPADRPIGRQAFACAHELGHYLLGHGTILDGIVSDGLTLPSRSEPVEHAANVFASHLLMPRAAMARAFRVRGWELEHVTAGQIYEIACALGVSYSGLIFQVCASFGSLDARRRSQLQRVSLRTIRSELLGEDCQPRLVVVDAHWPRTSLDLWVGDLALVRGGGSAENDMILGSKGRARSGELWVARRQGITRLTIGERSVFVRVSRARFIGLACNRFAPDPDVD